MSATSALIGVLLGFVLSRRASHADFKRDQLLRLRRMLSRDLDSSLLLHRRLTKQTGPVEAAVARWIRTTEADTDDLHLFLDLANVDKPSARFDLLTKQSELAQAIGTGEESQMLAAVEALLIELMRLSAHVDRRLGVRSGTREEWERYKGAWRPH